jgi:transposase
MTASCDMNTLPLHPNLAKAGHSIKEVVRRTGHSRKLVRQGKLSVTMRQAHAGCEKLFVDQAGDRMPVVVDRQSATVG